MDNTYSMGGKRKFITWLLVAVLLIAAVGAVFVVFNKKDNKEGSTGTYIQEGLVMKAMPTVRINEPTGIRFTAVISPELYNEVMADDTKQFGMVLAPISYFMKVDLEGVGGVDWMNAFNEEQLTVLYMDGITPFAITEPDGTLEEYRLNGTISSVKYSNTNLQFLGIAYVITTDGENVSYKYASFPDGLSYKQCSRSFAYVAAERLNECAVLNNYLSQADIDMLYSVINNSVDLANGLTEPTADSSFYAVTLSDVAKTIGVDEEFTINVDIAEAVPTSIWWQSSDTTVATVKDGVVTAHKEGTTTITAFVAGKEYKCVITVGEVQENTEAVVE